MNAQLVTLVPFRDAVRDATGGQPKVQRKDYQLAGDTPVIDQGQDFIAGYTDNVKAYDGLLPVVLFGDHTRAFKFVDFRFALGADGVKVLVPRQGFDARFLYYFFRSVRLPDAGYSRHFKFLRDVCVPQPSLAEQKRIVDLLSRAEGIVRLRREAQAKAAEIIPALFLDMFGDPATNPKGWPRQPLKALGQVVTGITPPSKLDGMFGGHIPFVTPGDLTRDTLHPERFLTDAGARRSRLVRSGATLVCCIGATIGKTDRTLAQSAFNQQINAVEWGGAIDDEFGVECLRLLAHIVRSMGGQTALPILKKSLFETIEIPVPPLKDQGRFAVQAASVRSVLSQQTGALKKAELTFRALLSRAFTRDVASKPLSTDEAAVA